MLPVQVLRGLKPEKRIVLVSPQIFAKATHVAGVLATKCRSLPLTAFLSVRASTRVRRSAARP